MSKLISELLSYRRKAKNYMQILSRPGYEVVIKVVKSWWNTRKLLFHHRDEVLGDLLHLIFRKKVGDLQAVMIY